VITERRPEIVVLAGVNGAGKSSVAGAMLMRTGSQFYAPDRAARRFVQAGLPIEEANARAWDRGRRQLESAISSCRNYAFESTLGGRTITRILLEGGRSGHRVRIWYVGLASPDLHIARVRARVARGGHDIPEPLIHQRWLSSRSNLVRLLPVAAELALYDNSIEADPHAGLPPHPARLLHALDGRIIHLAPPRSIPGWAKPVVAAALDSWPLR
jgi:predicted ABC-type ATPase